MHLNAILALLSCATLAAGSQTTGAIPRAGSQSAAANPPAAHAKNAKAAQAAYVRGRKAEDRQNWPAAFAAYSEAVKDDLTSREYLLRREIARGKIVGEEVERAERDALLGDLTGARRELQNGLALDPTDQVIRERLTQLAPSSLEALRKLMLQPSGVVRMKPSQRVQSFDFRGDTESAYEEVASQFGVYSSFDVDLQPTPVHLKIENADFVTAMRVLGAMTGTFWRPLTSRLFFVAADTPQKRRAYDLSVVRTVQLPTAESADDMTQDVRLVREIAGITRTELNAQSRTITMRASPQAISVAAQLLDQLEQPRGEVVLEMEVLEVDRNAASRLGITPPQSARVFSLSSQQIQEAEQGAAGLVSVIQQIFGTGSGLSGLSSTQLASLIGQGSIGIGSLIPPLIAFGGGKTTFLATLPGVALALSDTLNVVRSGRQILLRTENGKPSTFFVGERVPIDLAQFSASLSPRGFIPATSSNLFPESTIATGQNPVAVVASDFNTDGNTDLAVVNHGDNTVSILLGNGDGTFTGKGTLATGNGPVAALTADFNGDGIPDIAVVNQTDATVSIFLGNGDGTFTLKGTFATGKSPVAIASGDFNADGHSDLAVVNQADSTVSILLGNGDGTFQSQTTFATGATPSSIAASDFNSDGRIDLAVTNQFANTVSIFLGNGNGGFTNTATLATGNAPVAVVAGQFNLNNSANIDLAVASQKDNTLEVFLGNGNGAFTRGQTSLLSGASASGHKPFAIISSDFNVDGLTDLAVTDQQADTVSILIGSGDGTFASPLVLPAGNGAAGLASGRFRGATRPPDLAIADSAANELTIIQDNATFNPRGIGVPSTPYPYAEYEDIGLKIKATPYIQEHGNVTLKLHFELRSLTGDTINSIPIIRNETVEQTVSAKSGQTTALAGIIQSSEMRAINGSPGSQLLGPLSLAASSRGNQDSRTELLILLTPHIVREGPATGKPIFAGTAPAGGFVPGLRRIP